MMIKAALAKIADHRHLSEKEAEAIMVSIMEGKVSDCQIAAYLMGLRVKGETVDEITGSAKAMRSLAQRVHVTDSMVVDTCGTGGDGANTFNISTAAAFVVAGAGITVAKHGNRSVSSRSGSADVLTALGVNVHLHPNHVAECINEVGMGFLFAPLFHVAMKYCAKPRSEMALRTIMNILGPLSNPAGANIQLLGVYDQALTEKLATVLINLGCQHCFVFHGLDGLDEITLTNRTYVSEGKGGRVSSYTLDPKDFGLERVSLKTLQGGTPEENAHTIQEILQGRSGPKREIVLLNAAPAFVASEKVKTLQEGYHEASHVIDTGAAFEKLEKLIQVTNQYSS